MVQTKRWMLIFSFAVALILTGLFLYGRLPVLPMLSLLFLLCCGVIAFFQIRLLPFLLLAAVVVGQLVRIRLTNDSSGSLLLLDTVMGAYVGLGMIYSLATKKRLPITVSTIGLLGFLVWALISLLLGSSFLETNEILVALFYALRFLLMVGVLVITTTLFEQEATYQRVTYGIVLTGLLLTLLGYLQLLIFPSFGFMAALGWDPHEGRLLSTFFDPNFFGMFLVLITTLSLAILFVNKPVRSRWFLWVTFLLATVALIATFSRSSYLAFLIALLTLFLVRSWKLVIIALIAVAILGGSIPRVRTRIMGAFTVDATAQDRIQSWKEAAVIISDRPLTGVGYNAFGPAQIRYGLRQNLQGHSSRGSDSSFLLILATTGIVGLLLYLLFLFGIGYEALLLYRLTDSPYLKSIALATLGILPAYIVHSQFVNSLFYPLVFIPFLLIIAPVLFRFKQTKS